jgi:hypothetical protein
MDGIIVFSDGHFDLVCEEDKMCEMPVYLGVRFASPLTSVLDFEDAICKIFPEEPPCCYDPSFGPYCRRLREAILASIEELYSDSDSVEDLLGVNALDVGGPARTQRKKKVGGPKKNRPANQEPRVPGNSIAVVKQLIAADETRVPLEYFDQTILRNNAGAVFMSWRYTPNNIFQIDPAVVGAIPGRSYLTALYQALKVEFIQVSLEVTNYEAFNVLVGMYPQPANVDPGLNVANIANLGQQQPRNVSVNIGAVGGNNIGRLKLKRMSIVEWTGLEQADYDLGYTSLGGLAPTQLTYLACYAVTQRGGIVFVNGIDIRMKIKLWLHCGARTTIMT